MGVNGLGKFLEPYKNRISLENLSGCKVAIDTSIYLYKFKWNSTTEEFLNKFKFQIKKFKMNNITPIYIFDGTHNQLKQQTKDLRKETKVIEITKEDVALLKELIVKSECELIQAPTEGEKYCAYLNKLGSVDYVLSNDYDSILFGCKKLVTFQNGEYFIFDSEEILTKLDLTLDQLTLISIASGCDFNLKGIPGLGLKKALNLIKKGSDLPFDFEIDPIIDIFKNFDLEEKKCND